MSATWWGERSKIKCTFKQFILHHRNIGQCNDLHTFPEKLFKQRIETSTKLSFQFIVILESKHFFSVPT